MLLELPTGHVGGVAAAAPSCRNTTAILDKGRKVAAPGREQNLPLAIALGQLPSGTRLVIRDLSGREWCIRPGGQAAVIKLREAA